MKYQFNINLSEQEYIDFNVFLMIRSPYGKKYVGSRRLVVFAVFAVAIISRLIIERFSPASIFSGAVMLVFLALAQIFLTKYLTWWMKRDIKEHKIIAEIPNYGAKSVMTFFEDHIKEIAISDSSSIENSESKYSDVERVSVVDGKVIYFHDGNLSSYILPIRCFESEKQYAEFLCFIKETFSQIDVY